MDLLVGASFPSDRKDSHILADIPNPVTFGCRRTDPTYLGSVRIHLEKEMCRR
jgi:hypothetical protein